jgi:catalase
VNDKGEERAFRWRIVPWQSVMKYSKADAAKQSKNYQVDDLEYRLSHNKPVRYRLMAQLADPGDPTSDSTKVWLETNEFVEMGETVIDKRLTMAEGTEHRQEQ